MVYRVSSHQSLIFALPLSHLSDDEPHGVLLKACTRLKSSRHHPNCIGLQFVQIGSDPKAIPVLKKLTGADVGVSSLWVSLIAELNNKSQNMVDTVPYDGVLTSEKLMRILLGGIHPNVRAQLSKQG